MNSRMDHEYVNQLSPLAPSITSAQTFPMNGTMMNRRKPLSSTSSSTSSAMHSLPGTFGVRVPPFMPVANGVNMMPPNLVNVRKFSCSDEPEDLSDDHEYYNELDKLQRELQPLTVKAKNETTV